MRRNDDSRWPVQLAYALCLFLTCLVFVASFVPDKRLWGINHLAFYPVSIRFFAFALIIASFLPVARRFTYGLSERFVTLARGKQLAIAAILTVVGFSLFLSFDSSTLMLGDGQYIANNIEQALAADFQTFRGYLMRADRFYAGTEVLYLSVSRILSSVFGASPLTGAKILSAIFGALLVLLFSSRIIKHRSEYRQESVILALILLLSGSIQLFFGYVEMYAPLFFLAWLYFFLARRVITKGATLWGPAICVLVATTMHLSGLVLVPSLFFLIIWTTFRKQMSRKLLAANMSLLVATIAVPVVASRIAVLKPFLLPLTGNQESYGILSGAHLIDVANELLLHFPGIIVLGTLTIVMAARWIRGSELSVRRLLSSDAVSGAVLSELLFCAMLFIPAILLLFTVKPELGMARDWDLFVVGLVGLYAPVIVVFKHLGTDAVTLRTFRVALTPVLVTTSILTIAWVGINADSARSIARFESILVYDKTNAGYAYESLASYYRDNEDVGAEIRALEHAYNTSRNPRYLFTLGLRYYYIGEKEKAVLTLQKLLGISPNHERAHRSLVQMLYYTGRYDDTIKICLQGAGLAPGDPFYPFFTGKAYAQQGRTPEALKAFDECLKLQPPPVMSEEIDEFLKTVEQHRTEK